MNRFEHFELSEMIHRVNQYSWKRTISDIHILHSWRPNHDQWIDQFSIFEMYCERRSRGFGDLVQHLTIDPNGELIMGRDWNQPPDHTRKHNGTRKNGPFVMMIVGDFDLGNDELVDAQLRSAHFTTAYLLWKFRLPLNACRFMRQLEKGQTSPGSAIKYPDWIKDIEEVQKLEGMLR